MEAANDLLDPEFKLCTSKLKQKKFCSTLHTRRRDSLQIIAKSMAGTPKSNELEIEPEKLDLRKNCNTDARRVL